MREFALTTPIAFIIFNRPDKAERVFQEIARAKPRKLLIVGDGARKNRAGEAERVSRTREIIQRVNWDCDVLVNFSEENLGCRRRISSGIDWVFEQVPEAILLEDDCVPHPTFFRFCQELLEKYRDDRRIGMISGNNFQHGGVRNQDSYYFSRYCHVWGWATWRDRWQGAYDVGMRQWPRIRDSAWLDDILGRPDEVRYWNFIFERVFRGGIDTWDYQWVFANWLHGRLAVLPNVNLVSNIGFGPDATHTTSVERTANLPTRKMLFELRHPTDVIRNAKFDRLTFETLPSMSILMRMFRRVAQILHSLPAKRVSNL